MSDPFSDLNLMNDNLAKIDRGDVLAVRVSAEHYLWLVNGRSLVLQLIRHLVEIERDYAKLDAAFERHLNPPLKPNPAMKKTL